MKAFLSTPSPWWKTSMSGSAREEADWMALLAAIHAHEEGPGGGALFQELVLRERARMRAMVSPTAPAQH